MVVVIVVVIVVVVIVVVVVVVVPVPNPGAHAKSESDPSDPKGSAEPDVKLRGEDGVRVPVRSGQSHPHAVEEAKVKGEGGRHLTVPRGRGQSQRKCQDCRRDKARYHCSSYLVVHLVLLQVACHAIHREKPPRDRVFRRDSYQSGAGDVPWR
jgi:hypothetical protein